MVRPAALKISLPVDAIVERAREVKVLGEQPLDRRAVVFDIGAIAFFDEFRRIEIGAGRFLMRGQGFASSAPLIWPSDFRALSQGRSDAPSLSSRSFVPRSRDPASS
jgi:hypothetical protein